jgi:hypothetical protein
VKGLSVWASRRSVIPARSNKTNGIALFSAARSPRARETAPRSSSVLQSTRRDRRGPHRRPAYGFGAELLGARGMPPICAFSATMARACEPAPAFQRPRRDRRGSHRRPAYAFGAERLDARGTPPIAPLSATTAPRVRDGVLTNSNAIRQRPPNTPRTAESRVPGLGTAVPNLSERVTILPNSTRFWFRAGGQPVSLSLTLVSGKPAESQRPAGQNRQIVGATD